MCIAIHKPAGVTLDEAIYNECFWRNRDGAGIAYVEDNELKVEKGFFSSEAAKKAIRLHEAGEMLIHFRIKTHGVIHNDNCHPFLFHSPTNPEMQFAVMHNGTLPYKADGDKSDTRTFCDDVLFPILDRDPWFLDNPATTFLLREFICERNKVVVMRYDKNEDKVTTYILNKLKGETAHGCWFSNGSWKPVVIDHDFTRCSRWGGGMQSEWFEDYDARQYGKKVWNDLVKAFVNEEGWFQDPKTNQWRNLQAVLCHMARKHKAPEEKPEGGVGAKLITEAHAEAGPGLQIVVRDGKPGVKTDSLGHLTKAEKKTLHLECKAHAKWLGLNSVSGMHLKDQIRWLRDDLIDNVPGYREMDDVDIDRSILREGAIPKLRAVVTQKFLVGCEK